MEKSLSPTLRPASEKIENFLQNGKGVVTIADASSVSGLSLRDAKDVMDALIAKYKCRLQITNNGDLIYDFGDRLARRSERTWAEWWQGTRKQLWKVFVAVFKVWISITLVVYFSLFLIIIIGIIIASLARDGDGDSIDVGDGIGGAFRVLGELMFNIFYWRTVTNTYHYETDSRGYSYRAYDARTSSLSKKGKNKGKKGFVASVYDFVFGPPRVEANPLENQQEVASYLRKNQGVIVKPEMIGLAGWTGEKADDFFSEIIARFDGEPKISNNKILYGDFQALIKSKDTQADAPIIWYWNEYEPEYKLTGNTQGRNLGVGLMNGFNLIVSSTFLAFLITEGNQLTAILLGWLPFMFSVLFFTLPVYRWFDIQPKRKKRRLENIRKRLMRTIFEQNYREISIQELTEVTNNRSKGEESLKPVEVEKMMQTLIYDLDGELGNDKDGQLTYRFYRLQEELQEAKKLRESQNSDNQLGEIVFDTDD
jgi:hypothetical protein